MKPSVLILDEPTAGLDPKAHKDILEMIGDIQREEKIIIIFVSHNMDDVAKMADKVIVMDNGHVEMQGTSIEVFGQGDRLKKIGLDVPEITTVVSELNKKGFNLDIKEFSEAKVFKEILAKIKGGSIND